jgi:hypothetical protein
MAYCNCIVFCGLRLFHSILLKTYILEVICPHSSVGWLRDSLSPSCMCEGLMARDETSKA